MARPASSYRAARKAAAKAARLIWRELPFEPMSKKALEHPTPLRFNADPYAARRRSHWFMRRAA